MLSKKSQLTGILIEIFIISVAACTHFLFLLATFISFISVFMPFGSCSCDANIFLVD